jgi:hypothetical protein
MFLFVLEGKCKEREKLNTYQSTRPNEDKRLRRLNGLRSAPLSMEPKQQVRQICREIENQLAVETGGICFWIRLNYFEWIFQWMSFASLSNAARIKLYL